MPLDYFRIEDQIFEGFWSITQLLFIGFGKRICSVKNLQMFDLQSLNDIFQGHFHRPLALLIHPLTQQSSAKQVRAY